MRLHWSIPLGALFFGRFQFVPAFWAAFFGLVLIHEIGHAQIVRRCRQRVLSIDVHAFGGACQWDGEVTPIQRAAIAWGGVLAQAGVLLLTLAAVQIFGPPRGIFEAQIADVFINTNAFIMAFNLIPVPPLDGAEAWKIVPLLRARWRTKKRRRQQAERERLDAAIRRKMVDLDAVQERQERLSEIDPKIAAEADELMRRITQEIRRERQKNTNAQKAGDEKG